VHVFTFKDCGLPNHDHNLQQPWFLDISWFLHIVMLNPWMWPWEISPHKWAR